MTTVNDIFNELEDAQAKVSKVILCNPQQKEMLEKVKGNNAFVYLIEDANVELNQAIVVKDLELKKMFISNYLKNRRLTE